MEGVSRAVGRRLLRRASADERTAETVEALNDLAGYPTRYVDSKAGLDPYQPRRCEADPAAARDQRTG